MLKQIAPDQTSSLSPPANLQKKYKSALFKWDEFKEIGYLKLYIYFNWNSKLLSINFSFD